MRQLGLILLMLGFFGAAFVSVRELDQDQAGRSRRWTSIAWPGYATFLAVGIAGVVLLRTSARRVAAQSTKAQSDLRTLSQSLSIVEQRLKALLGQREQVNVYDVAGRLESEVNDELARFADARETMIPLFGLQAYADLMSDFAGAERSINRAWCASSDGYIDEVWACVERGYALIQRAQDAFHNRQRAAGLTAAAPA